IITNQSITVSTSTSTVVNETITIISQNGTVSNGGVNSVTFFGNVSNNTATGDELIGLNINYTRSGRITLDSLEFVMTGYTDSDPDWFKYQDYDPIALTSDTNNLNETMAKLGFYEITPTVNDEINPFNDLEFAPDKFSPFSQLYYTDLFLDYSEELDPSGNFPIDLKFANCTTCTTDFDITIWVNGIKYPTYSLKTTNEVVYSGVKVRPGYNSTLLELVVGPNITSIYNGNVEFQFSIDNPETIDYFHTSVPRPNPIRIPFYYYDPSKATADIDAAPITDDFNSFENNSNWDFVSSSNISLTNNSNNELEVIKDKLHITDYSITQNIPRAGEFTFDTTLSTTIVDPGTQEGADGDIDPFFTSGFIIGPENNPYKLLFNYQFDLQSTEVTTKWFLRSSTGTLATWNNLNPQSGKEYE
ncbi:hypothetical protein LCGC14_2775330, partial [marine sediment metagenome]